MEFVTQLLVASTFALLSTVIFSTAVLISMAWTGVFRFTTQVKRFHALRRDLRDAAKAWEDGWKS